MAITTYGSLKTAVANHLDRTDLTSLLTEFVQLAESRIRREVQWVPEVYSAAQGGTLTYSTTPLTLSLFIRGVRSVWLADSVHLKALQPLSATDWREHVQSNANATGTPTHFFLSPVVSTWGITQGSRLYLWPQPAAAIAIDLLYDRDLTYPGIVAAGDAGASSLLTVHPDLYLYATLLEAASYLQHDERIPLWEQRYRSILKGLRIEADASQGFHAGPTVRLPRTF